MTPTYLKKGQIYNELRVSHPFDFSKIATDLTIIFSENPFDLKHSDWENMRNNLNLFQRNRDWGQFMEMAYNMTILSAKRVNIAESGLELEKAAVKIRTGQHGFANPTQPLPEERRF